MTEQPVAPPPAGKQPPDATAQDDPRERAEKLRAELAMAEAALPVPPGTVRVRVLPPHDTFTLAGVTVGPDFTPVPAGALTGLLSAAADAGVTIEEA
jgi:hypothetical protein